MSELKTDYVNDELAISMGGKRRYRMIENSDGTVSFEDVTSYSVVGDEYDADDINSQNETINQLNNDLNKKALVNTYYNASTRKLYQINADGTQGGEITMGIPILDFANPIFTFTSEQLSFTATKECYITGSLSTRYSDNNNVALSINNKVVFDLQNASNTIYNASLQYIKIKAGDVVTLNRLGTSNVKIYDVIS